MLRSHNVWLVPAALTLVGFGAGVPKAIAQTTYPFEPTTYNAEITTRLLEGNVLKTNVKGENANAPYGLTNLTIGNYASVDPGSGVVTYGPDPAQQRLV